MRSSFEPRILNANAFMKGRRSRKALLSARNIAAAIVFIGCCFALSLFMENNRSPAVLYRTDDGQMVVILPHAMPGPITEAEYWIARTINSSSILSRLPFSGSTLRQEVPAVSEEISDMLPYRNTQSALAGQRFFNGLGW